MSIDSVPYGTYTYSVTLGGTAVAPTNLTLNVQPNTVQVINDLDLNHHDDVPSRTRSGAGMITALPRAPPGRRGMTLVELLVTSTVLIILLGMVFVSITMVDARAQASPPSTRSSSRPFRPWPRSTHSSPQKWSPPARRVAGVPTPGFAFQVGNFSLTFYAMSAPPTTTRLCPQPASCTTGGTTAGPAKIVGIELDANGNPATACSPTSPCSFQLRMYLPSPGSPHRGSPRAQMSEPVQRASTRRTTGCWPTSPTSSTILRVWTEAEPRTTRSSVTRSLTRAATAHRCVAPGLYHLPAPGHHPDPG